MARRRPDRCRLLICLNRNDNHSRDVDHRRHLAHGSARHDGDGAASSPETWTQVAATWNRTTLSLYMNGELAGTSPRAGTMTDTAVEARIGSGEQEELDGNELSGFADELTIYGRALNDAEIAAIHAAGTAGKCRP